MRRARLLILFVSAALVVSPLLGQTTPELSRRTPERVEQMRRSERQVTLDVQVSDKSGKPVSGLQQRDLTLLDNGQPQALSSFREINESNRSASPEVILLLDTMNVSFQDVVIERQGMEAFLRQNGGRLAVPVSIVFLADTGIKVSKTTQDGNSLVEDLRKVQTPVRVIGPQQGAEGAQDRSQRSLRALQLLSTYAATRPGRKLLIWVGTGWPFLSRSTAEVSAQDRGRYFNSIVDLTTSLRRAHITLYSVAPLNLAQVGGPDPFLYKTFLKGVENPKQADSPNLALQVLAVHSGGLVIGQSGDLASQIELCMADGKNYYEITFDAPERNAAVQYRSLQVTLERTGTTARTSTAYYAGVAQSTSGEVPPMIAASSPSATPATTPAGPATVRAEARLVIVDLTVLDNKGLPVKGLSSKDFTLREDGAPQRLVSLEEHSAPAGSVAQAATDANPDGTIVATNKPPARAVWNVLLVDLYNTANEDRGRLRSQVEQFLKQLPQDEPLALVTMSNHIRIETAFQDGAGAAYRYLQTKGLGPLDATIPASIVERQEIPMPSADPTGSVITHQADIDVDRQANRAQTTLDCFSALSQWLLPYAGRKNVYWLSGGFALQGQPFGVAGYDPYAPDPGPETKGGHPIPMQQKTNKELENARVAIYPVDARGVAAPDIPGVTSADTEFTTAQSIGLRKDNDQLAAKRAEMLAIAKATGGVARIDNNITQALRDDFNQANSFYTIAYTPPDKEWKGAYHRTQIAVDQPGVQLGYRQGYYARSADSPSSPTQEQFKDALRLDAPSATAVQFVATITKAGKEATAEFSVEPGTVDLQQDPSGQFLTDIVFAILQYDAKGKLLDQSSIRLRGSMTAQQREHLTAKTLSAKQTIPLKAGATTLVLGARDRVSGRFGKVEASLIARQGAQAGGAGQMR